MAAGGVTEFRLSRFLSEAYPWNYTTQETYRGLVGARGKLRGFDWEISAQHGENTLGARLENLVITNRLREASDAVLSGGNIICRSTLTVPGNGCVPFNWAGAGSPSAQAIDYVTGDGIASTKMEENFVSGEISGEVYKGWGAGPISVALGFDYRDVATSLESDPLSEAGAFNLGNQVGWEGKYDISEVFGELDIPILADLPFAKALSLNLAGRRTHYSTSGDVTTWKAGVVYQPVQDLRFRTTLSHDIRAPNLFELFSKGRAANQTIEDPNFNRQRYSNIPVISSGNPDLEPEVADTFTIGAVYSPGWLPGFNASIDYYDITVDGAISNLAFQDILDRCAQGETALCSFVTRDTTSGLVTRITAPTYGLQTLEQNGIDYEIGYRVPAADWFSWWQGSLSLRLVATNLRTSMTLANGAIPRENAGAGSLPHWKGTFTANYDVGSWKTFLQVRYVGDKLKSNDYVEGIDIDNNQVRSVAYLDGQISHEINANLDLYLNVQNLLDRGPPIDPGTGNWFVPTNENLYDQIGRMYRVGLRFKF